MKRIFLATVMMLTAFCQGWAYVRVVVPEDKPVEYNVYTDKGYAEAISNFKNLSPEEVIRDVLYIRDEVEFNGVCYPVKVLSKDFYHLWNQPQSASPKTVRLPAMLESIGNDAFRECSRLKYIFLPSTLQKLGDGVFLWSENLGTIFNASKTLNLDTSYGLGGGSRANVINVDTIYQTADFSYYIFDSLRYIYDIAEASHIDIPEGYQVGAFLCQNFSSLQSVSLPSDLSYIGEKAFYGCENLNSIDGLEHVTTIGKSAFARCFSLEHVQLCDSMRMLGETAFQSCTGLKSIHLPQQITQLPRYLLQYCVNLPAVQIPEGVTEIGLKCFEGCLNLTDVTLPVGLKIIGKNAFERCRGLKEITLPESVTTLGMSAFLDCDYLEYINYGQHVADLGGYCFCNCRRLKQVLIPDRITELNGGLFKGCVSLTEIEIPAGVVRLRGEVFSGCKNLRYLKCNAVVPPAAENNSFQEMPYYQIEVRVPAGSVDDYKNARWWDWFRYFNQEWPGSIDAVQSDTECGPSYDLFGRLFSADDQPTGFRLRKDGSKMIVR